MVNPPEGWKPKGWTPPEGTTDKKGKKVFASMEMKPLQMLRTWQFYALWSMFMVGALAGLMVIGNIKNFANSESFGFQNFGFTAKEAEDYAVIGAAICLPILNGLGRIVWGIISDKIGRKRALIAMSISQAVMMGIFFFTVRNPVFFYVIAAAIGFNFGGNFALFPAATADYYGSKNVGPNYGIVFTSYAAGGIIGPILAGIVQDNQLSFLYAFIPAAVLCLVAAGIGFALKAPTPKE
jgi:OFA family oxalate/formate antiporter-like MFS transporter